MVGARVRGGDCGLGGSDQVTKQSSSSQSLRIIGSPSDVILSCGGSLASLMELLSELEGDGVGLRLLMDVSDELEDEIEVRVWVDVSEDVDVLEEEDETEDDLCLCRLCLMGVLFFLRMVWSCSLSVDRLVFDIPVLGLSVVGSSLIFPGAGVVWGSVFLGSGMLWSLDGGVSVCSDRSSNCFFFGGDWMLRSMRGTMGALFLSQDCSWR